MYQSTVLDMLTLEGSPPSFYFYIPLISVRTRFPCRWTLRPPLLEIENLSNGLRLTAAEPIQSGVTWKLYQLFMSQFDLTSLCYARVIDYKSV